MSNTLDINVKNLQDFVINQKIKYEEKIARLNRNVKCSLNGTNEITCIYKKALQL